jgi:hypothetical protein
MAISLTIPKVSEPVRVNFKLREDLVKNFNLYVKAAKLIERTIGAERFKLIFYLKHILLSYKTRQKDKT